MRFLVHLLVLVNVEIDTLLEDDWILILLAESIRVALLRLVAWWSGLLWFRFGLGLSRSFEQWLRFRFILRQL